MIKPQEYEFLTADKDAKLDPTYQVIQKVLSDLVRTGGVALGTGYCLSMSDIIRTLLKHRGIDSKLVDCQATLSYNGKNKFSGNMFIGYPNMIKPGEIDTHVVVVTSTVPAYLIDASIANRLPPNKFAVVEPVKFNSDNQFSLVNVNHEEFGLKVTYQEKKSQSASYQHQKSIVERIEMDTKINNDIQILKQLNYIGITLGAFSLINVVFKILGYW